MSSTDGPSTTRSGKAYKKPESQDEGLQEEFQEPIHDECVGSKLSFTKQELEAIVQSSVKAALAAFTVASATNNGDLRRASSRNDGCRCPVCAGDSKAFRSKPGETPEFDGSKVSVFLEDYEEYGKRLGVCDRVLMDKLPQFTTVPVDSLKPGTWSSWAACKEGLITAFCARDQAPSMKELQALANRKLQFAEFGPKFKKMAAVMEAHRKLAEFEKRRVFISGLTEGAFQDLRVQYGPRLIEPEFTFEELYLAAEKAVANIEKLAGVDASRRSKSQDAMAVQACEDGNDDASEIGAASVSIPQAVQCQLCDQFGHKATQCSQQGERSKAKAKASGLGKQCFGCGKAGHGIVDCSLVKELKAKDLIRKVMVDGKPRLADTSGKVLSFLKDRGGYKLALEALKNARPTAATASLLAEPDPEDASWLDSMAVSVVGNVAEEEEECLVALCEAGPQSTRMIPSFKTNAVILGKIIRALLDDGSDVNLMLEEVAKSLGIEWIQSPESLSLRMADRSSVKAKGWVDNVPIEILGVPAKVSFLIVSSCAHDVVIGNPGLHALGHRVQRSPDGSSELSVSSADGSKTVILKRPTKTPK